MEKTHPSNEAAAEIIKAIELATTYEKTDVLILARGGGNIEDLWPFNEELVARAIFASPIPIVSGVGHEIDFTIADLVADMRAPTPSAAAELVSPNRDELLQRLASIEKQLHQKTANILQYYAQKIVTGMLGKRRFNTLKISRMAAPVGEVITPMGFG